MKKPDNLKVGDKFRVTVGDMNFKLNEIITLKRNDGSNFPLFWNADKSDSYYIYFSRLEPLIKSIRDVQIGNVVVWKSSGFEYLVLERWQNTVVISQSNDFKKAGDNYTFDELEEYFTLKAEPVVVSEKTAEAIKVLEEAGYKISIA